ncbi:MAG: Asp-tRNA(Asn)/Glu-tRNA(Gln) amidotransferase subunit GatC [Oscillospiraceae bacterium]|jgi:aspartyl-tRNA(Asn)/glutamyl-tRNA(Gln) amidotransferase subunit C|nr:Asp-tRNA(Asn)/Glu-tRNA(Gln) amidotransferase subunit GatC [Oscillospiraceae bacterium]
MINKEDVLNIALLSKLYVADDKLDELTAGMQEIISFADTINSAEVENTEFDNINNLSDVFREDVVVESYPREEILKNAIEQDEGHFLVKKRV